jgi:hypothetical protein
VDIRGRKLRRRDLWERRKVSFNLLAVQEAMNLETQSDYSLQATFTYGEQCQAYGKWEIRGANNVFQKRFRFLGERAGAALGVPDGIAPLDFWCDRLLIDLLKNQDRGILRFEGNSPRLFEACGRCKLPFRASIKGRIRRIAVASALFCFCLEGLEGTDDWAIRRRRRSGFNRSWLTVARSGLPAFRIQGACSCKNEPEKRLPDDIPRHTQYSEIELRT